jgi:hypothetical protein
VRSHSRDRVCLAIAVALAATGCSTREWIARFVPPTTDQYARRFIDTLQNQPAQATVKLLVSRVAMEDGIVDSIATLQRHIPQGRPDSLQIVDVNVQTQNGSTRRTSRMRCTRAAGGRSSNSSWTTTTRMRGAWRGSVSGLWTRRFSLVTH